MPMDRKLYVQYKNIFQVIECCIQGFLLNIISMTTNISYSPELGNIPIEKFLCACWPIVNISSGTNSEGNIHILVKISVNQKLQSVSVFYWQVISIMTHNASEKQCNISMVAFTSYTLLKAYVKICQNSKSYHHGNYEIIANL